MAIILCDIDYFKTINDLYGHDTGDNVLQEFAQLIQSMTNKTAICVRWGGEEFLIICPVLNANQAFMNAEQIRIACAATLFAAPQNLSITSSFGISIKQEQQSFNDSIHNADKALYQAKQQGRNKTCLFSPEE